MKRYFDQLKPGERRVVAIVGMAVFLVLNYLFVWPHFSEWNKAAVRRQKAEETIEKFRAELRNRPVYEKKIKELQAGGGSEVVPEEQAIDFVHLYSGLAAKNHVQVLNNSRLITRTNDPFFVDHEMQLSVQARENQLVNFLYDLGADNSIVRVRNISLHPDSSHQQINASISIVASYQKKPTPRPATPAAKAAKAAPVKTEAAHANKPLVTVSKNSAATNKPVPITAKRP